VVWRRVDNKLVLPRVLLQDADAAEKKLPPLAAVAAVAAATAAKTTREHEGKRNKQVARRVLR
jgi:hypothetical protein